MISYEEALFEIIENSGAIDEFNDWDKKYENNPMEYINNHKEFFNANIDSWEKELREGWNDTTIELRRF